MTMMDSRRTGDDDNSWRPHGLVCACALTLVLIAIAAAIALHQGQNGGQSASDDDAASPAPPAAVPQPDAASMPIIGLAFSPNGRSVLAVGDSEVAALDVTSGSLIRRHRTVGPHAHRYGVISVAVSPDGAKVLTGSRDGTAILWNATSGEELRRFRMASSQMVQVTGVAFNRDGGRVLTCSDDRGIVAAVWDWESGERIAQLTFASCDHAYPNRAVFSRNGVDVILATAEGAVVLWHTPTNRTSILRACARNQGVFCVAASPVDERAVTAAQDGRVIVWDVARAGKAAELEGRAMNPADLIFSADGKQILAAGLFSANGERIASGGNGTILWDASSGNVTRVIDAPSSCVAFSPDGTLIATASNDGRIVVWEQKSGRVLRVLREGQKR